MKTNFRLSTLLLAGAALTLLAACGPGEAPGDEPASVDAVEEPAAIEAASTPTQDTSVAGQEDEDAHAHEEGEDHDHDHDEDHAGGGAHVHGIADLAFTFEGATLSADLMSPLANFGLSEADGVFPDDAKAALPGLISIVGGDCTPEVPVAEIDASSGHTDAHVRFSWTCINPANVTSASFTGFTAFPGFETINAVYVGDAVQKAAELTPSSPELSLK